MRSLRWVGCAGVLGLLAPASARADSEAPHGPPPSTTEAPAPDPLLANLTRTARHAATTGHCDVVRDIGTEIKALDARYHATTFAVDPIIVSCMLNAPGMVAPVIVPAPVRAADPPLSGGRILGEVLVGGLAGVGGAIIGGYAGAGVCADHDGEFACLGSILIGGYAGGTLALSLGVYAIGNTGDETGSLGATVGGGVIGGLGGIGLALALAESHQDSLAGVAILGGPMIGALVGFNVTRRYDRRMSQPTGALLHIDRGGVALGMPLVTRGESHGQPTTNVTLLGGTF